MFLASLIYYAIVRQYTERTALLFHFISNTTPLVRLWTLLKDSHHKIFKVRSAPSQALLDCSKNIRQRPMKCLLNWDGWSFGPSIWQIKFVFVNVFKFLIQLQYYSRSLSSMAISIVRNSSICWITVTLSLPNLFFQLPHDHINLNLIEVSFWVPPFSILLAVWLIADNNCDSNSGVLSANMSALK